jgi:hypothetical protein
MATRFIPLAHMDATPAGWFPIVFADGSFGYDRPADERDAFAIIDDDRGEFVIAATADEARRVDAERSA